jgi:hypothetical protein
MKIKTILSLISLVLFGAASQTLAAGHGGGGGGFGGGGHFAGGGHFGGGGGGGRPGGGAGAVRPAYFYSRGMAFANSRTHYASAPWLNPVHRSQSSVGEQRATINHPITSNAGANHVATNSATHPARTSPRPTFNGHVAERHSATNWHGDWDRRRVHFDHDRFFVFDDGFWFGLDPGFFPWDYYPYYAYDYYPYDYYPGYYADVEPYYYNEGVYSDTPVSDPTVATVQTDLTQQGYYGGPVNGIYGPATRDAVAKYQIAKNLDVTGSLSPDTLKSLGLPPVTPS